MAAFHRFSLSVQDIDSLEAEPFSTKIVEQHVCASQ